METKFNERFKKLLIDRHISQGEFAKILNLSRGTICMYCSGRHNPPFEVLADIANELNVTTDYLLGITDYENAEHFNKEILNSIDTAIDAMKFSASKLVPIGVMLKNKLKGE